MMDRSYVEAMQEVTRRPMTEGGRVFIPSGWTEAPKKVHAVGAMVVHTLSGLVDYCTANRDQISLPDCMVHVKDPGRVELRHRLEGEDTEYRRHTYLVATTEMVGRCALTFGQYVDAETFYIALQTGFTAAGHRDDLLRLIASIRENSVREVVDSGVSQEVKTGRGVVLVGSTALPNPVELAPHRTFLEVEQPRSIFVLRAKDNPNGERPMLALFEADGGKWKLDAITNIAGYLRGNLPETAAVLA